MEPSQHVRDSIGRIQEHRGWILSSYAQIEYLFSDLVMRGCEFEDYQKLGKEMPFPVGKRLKRARKILETNGIFSQFSERLLKVLDTFEERAEFRNILAHGFMTVFHDPKGQIQYEFRKWHWTDQGEPVELVHRCFEVHLDYEANRLMALADEASNAFREVHEKLGLVG